MARTKFQSVGVGLSALHFFVRAWVVGLTGGCMPGVDTLCVGFSGFMGRRVIRRFVKCHENIINAAFLGACTGGSVGRGAGGLAACAGTLVCRIKAI